MKRLYRRPTHCINGHRFTPENTYTTKEGWRSCRTCGRRRAKQYQARKRAEGLAKPIPPEWFREYRSRVRQGLHIPQQRKREPLYVSREILDLLEIDAGWLTAEGIALHLDFDPQTVSRTLYRLREKNLVESRIVGLASSAAGRLQSRSEWRAA